ncbi:MAG: GspE/PulE family protein, partial [Haliea sp.]
SFTKGLLSAVVGRIKIIGRMDIAERRLPQDGHAKIIDNGNAVDLRISVIPTVNGESVVIRLLNTQQGLKSIKELGFNENDAETFINLLNKSYGIILVTGPTGSGKSTTLYAALQEVIKSNLNIITVEDPVEYHIEGIEQIQVNTAPGFTFAKALRHILRHDPDVIMVGEIRDQETAKIAIESALTGHLVLSTLHTNDAPGAISRLLEMGIDPFLLNGALLGVFAQRLLRRNCPHCLAEENPEPRLLKALGITEPHKFYAGTGCEKCNDTGYRGRMAAYELLSITPSMHALIDRRAALEEIRGQAMKDGMVPLTQNALDQALQKKTSLAEVYRVRLE